MASALKPTRSVVRGLANFQQFLQTNRAPLAASPIVLITSEPIHGKSVRPGTADAIRHVQSLLQNQMGFRTIPTANPVVFALPSVSDVRAVSELVDRVRATTVAAVGAGCAMDLAKAVAAAAASSSTTSNANTFGRNSATTTGTRQPIEHLLLVPATYGACLAAGSSHALVLDPDDEETIMVQPSTCAVPWQSMPPGDDSTATATTLVALEGTFFDSASKVPALEAAMTFLMDDALQGYNNAVCCFQDEECDAMFQDHDKAQEALLAIGEYIRYGLTDGKFPSSSSTSNTNPAKKRSIPLALAVSTLPSVFPEHTMINVLRTFITALAEEMYRKQGMVNSDDDSAKATIAGPKPSSGGPIVTNESWDNDILPQIKANRRAWRCTDASDRDLKSIFRHNMLLEG
jgi:Iron-containing alcohol dehydrogenase